MFDTTANLNLPFIAASQAQKHVTHNESLNQLDLLVQLVVKDKTLTAPPGLPNEGDRHIVAATATGDWTGKENSIVAWQDGIWQFLTPQTGWLSWVEADEKLFYWDGAFWKVYNAGLTNIVEDITPQLGGNLDTQSFTIGGRNIAADGTKLDGIETAADVTDDANVRAALAGATADIAINSQKITGAAAPSNGGDLANKTYVDSVAIGLDTKDAAQLATTANITLSGEQTIDGILTSTSRILVKNQTTGSENGIYVTAAGAWTRATDADADAEVTNGLYVLVTGGTVNANSGWTLTTADPITVGTTALTFAQFNGLQQTTAGAGMTKTGDTLNVIANSDGSVTINADDIQVGVLASDAQHGVRGGGTQHADATTSVAGFMSGADKTKLDGIETAADVTDAANVATAGAVMDSDISAAEGFLRKTGAGAYEAIKTNLAATVDPIATDDSTAGYAVGSRWINTTDDKSWECVDSTATAAVWKELSAGAGSGDVVGPASAVTNAIALFDGTTGKILKDSAIALAAKGDLLVHTGSAYAKLAAGTNDQVLTADSAQSGGVKWAASAGGGGAGLTSGAIIAWPTSSVPAGFLECDGAAVSMTTYENLYDVIANDYGMDAGVTFTTTHATEIINATAHGLSLDDVIEMTTSAADLPAGYAIDTKYFVINPNANDFQVSATKGGVAVTISDDGTGTHKFHKQISVPDLRGEFIRGFNNASGNDPDAASRTDRGDGTTGDVVGSKQVEEFKSHTHGVALNGNNASSGSGKKGVIADNATQSAATGGNETRPRNVQMMYVIKT